MRSFAFLILTSFFITVQSAFAEPIGSYSVEGLNAEDGSAYQGDVVVEKNGGTYTVLWNVGGEEFVGTGIGAANVKGDITFGNAAEIDTALAVSYVSGDSFGLALFVEQADGQWKGIWTYGGSDKISSETWTRK